MISEDKIIPESNSWGLIISHIIVLFTISYAVRRKYASIYMRKMSSHAGKKWKIRCIFGIIFSMQQKTNSHIHYNHLATKSHVCAICDYRAKSSLTIKKHTLQKHSDERKFECQKCEKKYKSKAILNGHLLTHGEKKFECEECDFSTKTKRSLTHHTLVRNSGSVKHFKCDLC